jgi:hypothetical protein
MDTKAIKGVQYCGYCNKELQYQEIWKYDSIYHTDKYHFRCTGCGMGFNGDRKEAKTHIKSSGKSWFNELPTNEELAMWEWTNYDTQLKRVHREAEIADEYMKKALKYTNGH